MAEFQYLLITGGYIDISISNRGKRCTCIYIYFMKRSANIKKDEEPNESERKNFSRNVPRFSSFFSSESVAPISVRERKQRVDTATYIYPGLDTGFKGVLRPQTFQGREMARSSGVSRWRWTITPHVGQSRARKIKKRVKMKSSLANIWFIITLRFFTSLLQNWLSLLARESHSGKCRALSNRAD